MQHLSVVDLFLDEDKQAIDIVTKYQGAIYGGYLRDIIAGVIPRDMDIVIFNALYDEFDTTIRECGYQRSYNEEHETFIYTKSAVTTLEVCLSDEEPGSVILGPVAEPDAQVNTLVYVEGELTCWTDPNVDINTLIDLIKRRETHVFEDIEGKRLQKLIDKGYTILGELPLP